jgi:hypothetical protein
VAPAEQREKEGTRGWSGFSTQPPSGPTLLGLGKTKMGPSARKGKRKGNGPALGLWERGKGVAEWVANSPRGRDPGAGKRKKKKKRDLEIHKITIIGGAPPRLMPTASQPVLYHPTTQPWATPESTETLRL